MWDRLVVFPNKIFEWKQNLTRRFSLFDSENFHCNYDQTHCSSHARREFGSRIIRAAADEEIFWSRFMSLTIKTYFTIYKYYQIPIHIQKNLRIGSWRWIRAGTIRRRSCRGGLGKRTSNSKTVWWNSLRIPPIDGRESPRGWGRNRRRRSSATTPCCWTTWRRSKPEGSSRRRTQRTMPPGRRNPKRALNLRKSKWPSRGKPAGLGPKKSTGKVISHYFIYF